MIYDIKTFLHDFFDIKMDHIRFHLGTLMGSLVECFLDRLFLLHLPCRLCYPKDLFLDELRCTHFEIYFLKFFDRASFETHREFFWFKFFRGLIHRILTL